MPHQGLNLFFNVFPAALKLFNGHALSLLILEFLKIAEDLIDLGLVIGDLPRIAQRNFLELGVGNQNPVPIPGGDFGAKMPPVLAFKISFGCD